MLLTILYLYTRPINKPTIVSPIRFYYIYSIILNAATAAEHAHYLSNKDIITPNRIYGIICPRINARTIAGKPARPRRVVVDLKVGRNIKKRDTITNPIGGNLTIITKGKRLEIAETCRYPKRY